MLQRSACEFYWLDRGGREHALAQAISRSPLCEALYAAPGNPGIGELAQLVPIKVDDIDRLVAFAQDEAIDFVVIGPELPLALGLVDRLNAANIPAFGPNQQAAQLEASKAFTKELCRQANIPTAAAEIFTESAPAKLYIRQQSLPIVIKADGLAAGKGVVIAQTLEEADTAIDEALSGAFGSAGKKLVIEAFLLGEEVSFFALCDGESAISFGSAQDHKAAYDGDKGPNTGGMGAYAPAPVFTASIEEKTMRRIIEPTLREMAARGTPFRGVLFPGLMIVEGEPFLIEYNARFGDPECEVLMARLDSDIVPFLWAAAQGKLEQTLVWKDNAAIAVVMATKGYPGRFTNGSAIRLPALTRPDTTILHAGTALAEDGSLTASGGRVLVVTATGPDLKSAQQSAYAVVDQIDWQDGFCRRDIGWRAL